MTKKGKLIWGIVIGITCAVTLFCLATCISCSVTGLTFPKQIVDWFSAGK